MKFIDEAIIEVYAGKGGPGSRHFRREKFVPLGGPDGGDGGEGGDVIVVADSNKHTLLDFRFNPLLKAQDGQSGGGANKSGKSGENLEILLPVGTQIIAEGTDEIVVDLTEAGQRFVLAKGGRGGKGNAFFKTPTNRAPDHAQPGEDGQSGKYKLSLKLVADVGLIGFPNAGKSTLISRISAAKPKIADYPFTTLEPNLGMAQAKGGRSFVVADIPGLIPGAHFGKGLGIKFLKHIERTLILAHLIDPYQLDSDGEQIDPISQFEQINSELRAFSEVLAQKSQIVILTKMDLDPEGESFPQWQKRFEELGHECLPISSASGKNIDRLVELLAQKVQSARRTA